MAISSISKKYHQTILDQVLKSGNSDLQDFSDKVRSQLKELQKRYGTDVLLDLFRLSGNIPEIIVPDSSEEKIYSKYTDTILAVVLSCLGTESRVLTARSNSADVVSFNKSFNLDFVSDAKAFRLSRTAKNQKDFKVTAMDSWKNGRSQAILVCPIYQLPTKKSQIYQQACNHKVLILTYSHLAVLVRYAEQYGDSVSLQLLKNAFNTLKNCNVSDLALNYWTMINKALHFQKDGNVLWNEELIKISETLEEGKKEADLFYDGEKDRILNLDHQAAIRELLNQSKIESKKLIINKVEGNGLFNV